MTFCVKTKCKEQCSHLKNISRAGNIWEAEVWRITVAGQTRKTYCKTPSSNNHSILEDWRHALSSRTTDFQVRRPEFKPSLAPASPK
jgi:hypothetical protein